jgi:ABC-type uncharacterized transport system involved in gliding motility auxiliary subunit
MRSLYSIGGIIALGVILLLFNAVSKALLSRYSLDFTEDGLYSLSKGTKNIVRSLEEPITLRYYFSKTDGATIPAVGLYGDRIRNLLEQYVRESDGIIDLKVYDPRPDSEEAEWAAKYGLQELRLATGQGLYLGLVAINSEGKEAAIPVLNFTRQEFLEYDITKLLYSITAGSKPNVAIFSSLPINGSDASAFMQQAQKSRKWYFVEQLEKVANVNHLIPQTDEIPADTDVLLVVHPKKFPRTTLYRIDQYVMNGGNLVAFVDPHCESDRPKQDPQNPYAAMSASKSSSLNDLTSKWGLELISNKVLTDINLSTKVSSGRGGMPVDFIAWLTLAAEQMEQESTVTGELENVMLPWPGALNVSEDLEGIEVERLLYSTTGAKLMDASTFKFGQTDPQDLLRTYVRGSKEQLIAARISGKLKTNFPDGQPSGVEGEEDGVDGNDESIRPYRTETEKSANVLIVADVDILADSYSVARQNILGAQIVTLMNDNLAFLQNAVENMAGSSDLISIRSRGQFSRPFIRVDEIERETQLRWQQEEMAIQAKLNEANQRLQHLQRSGGSGDSQEFNSAVLEEIKKFRAERLDAQQRLREIRRNARYDLEHLERLLFIINTFMVPALLILIAVWYSRIKKREA